MFVFLVPGIGPRGPHRQGVCSDTEFPPARLCVLTTLLHTSSSLWSFASSPLPGIPAPPPLSATPHPCSYLLALPATPVCMAHVWRSLIACLPSTIKSVILACFLRIIYCCWEKKSSDHLLFFFLLSFFAYFLSFFFF